MDCRLRGRNANDYSLYDKSYVNKSKKALSKVEEIRSKSGGKPLNARSVSPIIDKTHYKQDSNLNMVDTKKYIDFKKETGGLLNKRINKENIHNTSKSPSYANYLNLSKSKNQQLFSQSHIDKNYSANKSSLGYSKVSSVNKSKDKKLTNSFINSNYTDIKTKSRDISGSKVVSSGLNQFQNSHNLQNMSNHYSTPSVQSRKAATSLNPKISYSSNNYLQSTPQNFQKDKIQSYTNNYVNMNHQPTNFISQGKALANSHSTHSINTKVNLKKTNNIPQNVSYSNTGTTNLYSNDYCEESDRTESEGYLKCSQNYLKDKKQDGKINLYYEKEPKPINNYISCHSNKNIKNDINFENPNLYENYVNDKVSVYTNYKKVKKVSENILSSNPYYIDQSNSQLNKEVSDKMKIIPTKKIDYSNFNSEIASPHQMSYQLSKKDKFSQDLSCENRIPTDSEKRKMSNKTYSEKHETYTLNNYPSEAVLHNKDTSESIKFKLTNTHSSGGAAMHSLEEVKNLFNKLDPEEYHLVSVNLIGSSRRVVSLHEHLSEKDNLFTTVTKCEERDL